MSRFDDIIVDNTTDFTTTEDFFTFDDLRNWVNSVARSLGIIITKKRSKVSKKNELRKVWLQCERDGVYKDTSSSRESDTKKIGCPFELVACRNDNKLWNLIVFCGTHTHANASSFEGHAYAMRLNEEEKKLVAELTKANVKPRNILAIIKNRNENNFSSLTNVYNERHKLKTSVYRGSTRMEALMIALEANGFMYEVNANQETNKLEDLFFCHPDVSGFNMSKKSRKKKSEWVEMYKDRLLAYKPLNCNIDLNVVPVD